jgi:hypothetical protein
MGLLLQLIDGHMKGYKPEVTNPQKCKDLVIHFIQL